MDAFKQEFTVSMDLANRVLTGVVVVAMAVCAVGVAIAGLWPVALAVVFFLPVTALFAPRKYVVTPNEIIVWRAGPNVVIPRHDIVEVRPVSLRGVIRTCGAGGFLGAWGWFWSKELGSFRAYVTRGDLAVLLQNREGKKIVLTPDDADGFVELMTRGPLADSEAKPL